jgi:hypothetical protein
MCPEVGDFEFDRVDGQLRYVEEDVFRSPAPGGADLFSLCLQLTLSIFLGGSGRLLPLLLLLAAV